jgi:hypothetical protein
LPQVQLRRVGSGIVKHDLSPPIDRRLLPRLLGDLRHEARSVGKVWFQIERATRADGSQSIIATVKVTLRPSQRMAGFPLVVGASANDTERDEQDQGRTRPDYDLQDCSFVSCRNYFHSKYCVTSVGFPTGSRLRNQ